MSLTSIFEAAQLRALQAIVEHQERELFAALDREQQAERERQSRLALNAEKRRVFWAKMNPRFENGPQLTQLEARYYLREIEAIVAEWKAIEDERPKPAPRAKPELTVFEKYIIHDFSRWYR